MSIRDRNVPDQGPLYEEILDFIHADLDATSLVELPANVATLAAVQLVEYFVARSGERAEVELLPHALSGVPPHLMPRFEGEVFGYLDALTEVLRTIDRAGLASRAVRGDPHRLIHAACSSQSDRPIIERNAAAKPGRAASHNRTSAAGAS